MNTQPEALRHAEWLGRVFITGGKEAAAELRRLHEVNQELLAALIEAENAMADYVPSLEKRGASLNYGRAVIKQARAAIAKATGGAA